MRKNWQFWKLWYFQASVHALPMGISCAIMAVFVSLFSPLLFPHWVTSLRHSVFVFFCLLISDSLICQAKLLYYSVFTSTVNCNQNWFHTHRCTDFVWVIILKAPVCCGANLFLPLSFYGLSIRILISTSSSHFPWSVFIIIEQDEDTRYGSSTAVRASST